MSEIQIITEPNGLKRFAGELERQKTIAVDLEADSMHRYREKVCLLQFTIPGRTVLVDPLAIPDLSPLKPVLADGGVRKIFHAADYDIRCLYRDFEIKIHGLFDTMVCCQFLGEDKVGLADILKKYFNLGLDKKYQRADWSRRPIEEGMIRYAAEDTRHLYQLAGQLEQRLREKGRLDWVAEEFVLLEQVRHNHVSGPLFLRAKGARALKPRQLAMLEEMLQWRDREAQQRDCPLFKVLGTRQLMDLARLGPAALAEMKAIPGMAPRLVDRYGRPLLKAIDTARALPEKELPAYPAMVRRPRDPAAEARLKILKKYRARKAVELGMDPGIIINTALLEEISRNPPQDLDHLAGFPALKNWQRRILGPEILAALQPGPGRG
ncbi:MAG: ribonuclease D [Desulfobacterales bacterium]|nr:ribonuclease D [Desulfobacterales bacterium]